MKFIVLEEIAAEEEDTKELFKSYVIEKSPSKKRRRIELKENFDHNNGETGVHLHFGVKTDSITGHGFDFLNVANTMIENKVSVLAQLLGHVSVWLISKHVRANVCIKTCFKIHIQKMECLQMMLSTYWRP